MWQSRCDAVRGADLFPLHGNAWEIASLPDFCYSEMLTEIPRQESHGLGLYCVQKSKALFKRMRTSGKAGTKQRSLSQSALWVQIQEQVHGVEWKSQFMVGAFVRFLGKQRLKQPVFGALALLGPSGLAERLGPCRVGRGGRSLRALLHPPWKPRPPFPLTDALGKSLWERRRGVLTGHELGPCVRCCET